ncbi:sporulation integral membrane protein YtvI [Sporanaerobacter sp. PP17-6a]|uniref:sporulation integral membrane protein YtvI n=1 Tax=Sporanaerobacter sp. PP17-6a TaxID=1891289 RepID=UPI0008A02203|nr:sporulation integral membrane protein YtvI [Sporanaerobacter sp. PP17-6a]MBE6081298.1 sporulation integral membrane protein YtvI [Tissierellaceae bacterium]SCL84349.1 sporulation integral membrane protein YtvI [Sporanaerobacter sp. PP17-6a]
MFNEKFVNELKHFGIFLVIYTLIFILFVKTISYTFPFFISFGIAFLIQPLVRFFRDKLKLKKGLPSFLASLIIYSLFFLIVYLFFSKAINELKLLLINISAIDIDKILKPIQDFISRVGVYFEDIDPSFVEENSENISNIVKGGFNILGKGLNGLVSIAMRVPMGITALFVIIISTYFFSRDMDKINEKVKSIFSEKAKIKMSNIKHEGIDMITKYVKSYCLIYFLTFLQTLIGFSIFRIKYGLVLSIVCAIADILPILGPGLIYIPLAIIYFIMKEYFVALGIIILYLIISVVRQVIEPKIVSVSLGIHPVLVLAIMFIGLKAYGFWGLIYLTMLVVSYKVLKASNVF